MSNGSSFDSTKESLKKVLDDIASGTTQLPDFQRGWVWDDNHVKSLLARAHSSSKCTQGDFSFLQEDFIGGSVSEAFFGRLFSSSAIACSFSYVVAAARGRASGYPWGCL
ncbi:MAG: hypothetical protein ACOX5J_00990 [Candidatus Hydrogenedentales bacterium]|jgi:hypothetical protein